MSDEIDGLMEQLRATIEKPDDDHEETLDPSEPLFLEPPIPPFWEGGVPMDRYVAFDAASQSGLKTLATSPKHYRDRRLRKRVESRAMKLGTATHDSLVDPLRFFVDKYMVEPKLPVVNEKTGAPYANPRASKPFKEAVAALKAEHPDKIMMSREDWEKTIRMRDSVHADPVAGPLLAKLEHIEWTGVWADPETGIVCKMRPDGLQMSLGWNVNFKTSRDVRPHRLQEFLTRNNWHWWAAHYNRGLDVLEIMDPVQKHMIVAIENQPPHDVVCVPVREDAILQASIETQRRLHQLRECIEKDEWPGIARGRVLTEELTLTPWRWAEIRDHEERREKGYDVN